VKLYILYVYSVPQPPNRGLKTRAAILAAAHDLVTTAQGLPTMGAVAGRAGVSRLSVYHHFGSHAGLLEALAAGSRQASPGPPAAADTGERLRARVRLACERWASDADLFRRLPAAAELRDPALDHELAERLAAEDQLRPGCSLKEAEDVIALVTSFAAFDRFHQDGRRSTAAVADILVRLAGAVLNTPAQSPASSEH
jgi:AcrR family transcriptional regulator